MVTPNTQDLHLIIQSNREANDRKFQRQLLCLQSNKLAAWCMCCHWIEFTPLYTVSSELLLKYRSCRWIQQRIPGFQRRRCECRCRDKISRIENKSITKCFDRKPLHASALGGWSQRRQGSSVSATLQLQPPTNDSAQDNSNRHNSKKRIIAVCEESSFKPIIQVDKWETSNVRQSLRMAKTS